MTYNATAALLDPNVDEGRGGKRVYIDPARAASYAELQYETRQLANLLLRLGVRREQRVALIMLDTIEHAAVFLGAIRAGIIPVPLNTLLPSEQYAYILEDSRAEVVFVSEALLPTVIPALDRLPARPQVVVVGSAGAAGDAIAYSDAIAGETDAFDTVATHADETAFWLYSSGSTGMPKGTRHVHTSLMATAETYAHQVLGIREDDFCFSAAKLFFAYGLGNALTFPLSAGATTVLVPERPTPAVCYRILKEHAPTIFYAVPTLFAAMLGDKSLAEEEGSPRLRICVSAGEALPEHIGLSWKKRFGVDILDGVGSTEMLHIFLSNAPGDIKYGSSGRAVPGYDLRLLDEQGAPVEPGAIGELHVRGESSADGYWNQRRKSRATFAGDWTRTGDKYVIDADGRYVYCGRTDDMFKVSGQWVSPFEVESALLTHPAVLEAAVIACEDEDRLTKPKAFVVLKPDAGSAQLESSLQEHVKKAVGAWKYPRWVEVVDSLPKTATGKIQRFKLREMDRSSG